MSSVKPILVCFNCMSRSTLQRLAPLIGLLTLVVTPVLVVFAVRAQESNSNNVRDWLPTRFEATQRLKWYVERFGTDEILVVSWEGCSLDDARLDQLAATLTKPQLDSNGESRHLFRQVLTGRTVRDQLTSPPLSLGAEEAAQRMRGWLLGLDGTTCAIAIVSRGPDGAYDRHAAVAAAELAVSEIGIPDSEWRIAGPTADAVAIDRAGSERIQQLGMIAAVWGAFLAWVCLRDVVKALTVFFVAKLSWAASLSVVYLSGQNMDAVLMTMPALVFVLAISGAIHLTHYYQHAFRGDSRSLAIDTAVRNGWLPCALACATTAVGLGSLAISAVTPVVRFGTFSALGTAAVLVMLVVVWPAVSHLTARWHRTRQPGRTGFWWRPILGLTAKRWRGVLALSAVALPVLVLGVARLETSVKLSSLLPKSSSLIQSYSWLQDSIGPIVPMEIVLQFPESDDNGRTMLYRSRLIEKIRQRVESLSMTGGTIAATTFAPRLPAESGARQVAVRRIVANKLARNRDLFEDLHFIREHEGTELWRISTRVATGDSVDYGIVLDELANTVAEVLADDPRHAPQDIEHRICGGVPLIYMAQQQLMNDLRKSFVTAFGLIAIVMTLLLRRASGGILSMIPNVIPTLIVFGVMGLLRTPVDIGTMMTASVALGIAVDDTLHFLVWFRRGMGQYGNRKRAIEFAFENCATAMLHTSLICGLGMIPFVFSPFQPIARFAGVLCALLFAALLGDLIFLPAMLASPLGKFVLPRPKNLPQPQVADESLAVAPKEIA